MWWRTSAPTFSSTTPSAPFNVCRRIIGPYHIPAVSIELRGVLTNKTTTGAYRGTGSPEAAFCIERTMDLIAHDLELDPAEVRRRNFIPPDAFPYQAATGLTYDSGNYAQGLERAPGAAGLPVTGAPGPGSRSQTSPSSALAWRRFSNPRAPQATIASRAPR